MSNEPAQIDAAPAASKSTLWKRISGSRFFVVSILAHVLFIVVAGVIVMQTITAKRKLTFSAAPPAPTRAKEHKIEIQKKQQTTAPTMTKRITTKGLSKVVLPEMPDSPMTSPTLTKMTAAAGGMPSATTMPVTETGGGGSPISFFGMRKATASAFVGTFYDLKQTRAKQPIAKLTYVQSIQEFANGGFRESAFKQYYKGAIPLYTSMFMMPRIDANLGPAAFGVDKEVKPAHWVALYKAKVSPDKSGTYRFVGGADDIMLVSFGGKLVLDGSWGHPTTNIWKKTTSYDYEGFPQSGGVTLGDPIKVEAGKWYDMQILIGEQPGGQFDAVLMIMEDGVTYQKDGKGSPILPPFRVDNVRIPQQAPKTMIIPKLKRTGPVWKAQSTRPATGGSTSLLPPH